MSNGMKTLKCYDCDETFTAETSEDMLQHLYKHYMAEHHAVITGADPAEKKRWMEQFHTDFEAAKEV